MSIQNDQDDVRRRGRMARGLAAAGFEDVYVMSRESAREVLTERRLELLEVLRDESVKSVRALAATVDRDKGDVSRDVALLARHGLVTYRREGSRKVPDLAHETVVVEPVV